MNKETLQERLEREAAAILADEGELISALLLHNLVTHTISETIAAYQRDEKLTVSDVYAYEAGYEAGKNELEEDIRLLTEEIERLREDVEIARKAGIDEARKTILHQLECHIDNVKYAPSKPSDYRAWQDGFMEAYQQARKVIQYGHTKVKALNDTIKALQDNK